MKSSIIASALVASVSAAGRPASESICDYYTTALLKTNNATTQQTLLTLVVNTAVIGNYTQPNVGVKVPGILAPGAVNGTAVNLLQYFDGSLASTNNGGSSGVSMNFLDGGGAAPLMKNLPADNTSSNQYTLLTHLYEYFAVLLGCSEFGSKVTPYAGETSMYQVHRFMALDVNEVTYFIEQVGLSAASFGVATADIDAVAKALESAFLYRCSPPAAIPPTASPALQAICTEPDCPLSPNATCAAYSAVITPTPVSTSPASASGSMSVASGSMTMPMSSMMSSAPSSSPTVTPSNGAGSTLPTLAGLVLGLLGAGIALL